MFSKIVGIKIVQLTLKANGLILIIRWKVFSKQLFHNSFLNFTKNVRPSLHVEEVFSIEKGLVLESGGIVIS